MKTSALTALAASAILLTATAQDEPSPQPPPPPPFLPPPGGPGGPPPAGEGRFRDGLREKWMRRLTPEERERFQSARRKALEDPQIAGLRKRAEDANREFFEAMRKKMNEIDPGLEELIKKARRADDKPPRPGREGKVNPAGMEKREKGLASLTAQERQKLAAAREIARQSSAVQAAEQRRSAAKTPEERRAAAREHARAMKDAILSADPTLAPILEKLRPGPASEMD